MNDLLVTDAVLLEPRGVAQRCDILIERGTVSSVSPCGSRRPADVPTFDAAGRVVTAGWWNCHVHLTEPVWRSASRAPRANLQNALDEMFLRHGFTNVVDLASNSRTTLPLIERIASGELAGPRIATACEALHPPRGLPFYTKREVPWFLRWAIPTPRTAFGARRAVKARARRGARVTKLFTGSYVEPDRVRVMPKRTTSAAVTESRRRGMRTFAHPSNAAGVARAVEAGVEVLAHLPDETDGTAGNVKRFGSEGGHLVPTLDMFARTVSRDSSYLDPIDATLRTFIEAGGTVLFGTDVGYLEYRAIDGEVAAMARCGMTTHDILRSLTQSPAAFFGAPGEGQIIDGAAADLTVLSSHDANIGIADLSSVAATIVGGRVVWAHS